MKKLLLGIVFVATMFFAQSSNAQAACNAGFTVHGLECWNGNNPSGFGTTVEISADNTCTPLDLNSDFGDARVPTSAKIVKLSVSAGGVSGTTPGEISMEWSYYSESDCLSNSRLLGTTLNSDGYHLFIGDASGSNRTFSSFTDEIFINGHTTIYVKVYSFGPEGSLPFIDFTGLIMYIK